MSPRTSSQVGDDNIRAADTGGRPAVVNSFLNDDTALRMPQRPRGTAEQKAEADRLDAIEAAKASRRVAKFTMLLPHGCRGLKCRSKDHAADRDRYGGREDGGEGMHALLEMLGLLDAGTEGEKRRAAVRIVRGLRRFEK